MRGTLVRGFITLCLISHLAAQETRKDTHLRFEPASGAFQETLEVRILSEHPVHFTLDGSEPGPESKRYSSPLQVSKSTRIRAKAIASGDEALATIEANYLQVDSSLKDFSSPLPILVIENFGQGAIPNKRAEARFGGDGSGIRQVPRQHAALFLFEAEEEGHMARLTPTSVSLTTRIGIRVRGMSSSYQPQGKQNYSIETWHADSDKSADLAPLGLPAESDWALYTPAEIDRSLISNVLVYDLMREMGHYAARIRFVEVFLNADGDALTRSDFSGYYVLMEKIKRGRDRVPIEKLSEDGLTGGWIVQCDRMDSMPVSGKEEPFHFHTAGPDGKKATSHGHGDLSDDLPTEWNAFFNLHDPKGDKSTNAQRKAVTDWFDAFEKALFGPDFYLPEKGYRQFIDVTSFIDHSILVNLTRNFDSLNLSTYLYRPNHESPVFLNPPWDFDRSMGSKEWRDRGTDGMWGRERLWFPRLFADPEFNQALIDRWQDLRRNTLSNARILAMIDQYESEITAPVAEAHFQRLNAEFPDDFGGSPAQSDQWPGELSELKQWISERLAWLDQQCVAAPILTSAPTDNGRVTVSIEAPPNAEVYMTQDGSDPRRKARIEGPPIILLPTDSPVKAMSPQAARSNAWTNLEFDDSDWQTGRAGIGIGSEHQHLIQLELEPGTDSSNALARFAFNLESTQTALASLTLYMRYNDGFVAYLNGKEVASSNVPAAASRTWPLKATKPRFGAYARQPEPFDISSHKHLLKRGANVLAIHSTGRRSTLISPELIGLPGSGPEPSPSAQKYRSPMTLANPETTITARARVHGQWSGPIKSTSQ